MDLFSSTPDDGFEPQHESSPTDRFIYEMQLYGYRPFQDEPDLRPLPEEPAVQSALTAIFGAFFEMLGDTRLEPDFEDLHRSTVNVFHRAGQREQDGSEVRSVEFERHIAEGITLLERRNAFEFMRDLRRRPVRGGDRLGIAAARRIESQSRQHDGFADR